MYICMYILRGHALTLAYSLCIILDNCLIHSMYICMRCLNLNIASQDDYVHMHVKFVTAVSSRTRFEQHCVFVYHFVWCIYNNVLFSSVFKVKKKFHR
jgi:hypothetical protein